jgi:hypothetical protein
VESAGTVQGVPVPALGLSLLSANGPSWGGQARTFLRVRPFAQRATLALSLVLMIPDASARNSSPDLTEEGAELWLFKFREA